METPILNHVLIQLQAALERDDLIGAANIIEALRPPDQADLFYELDEEDQVALLPKLNPADILEEMDDEDIAIFTIVLWANTLGSLLPLLALKLKIDPTVVSGPAMSTLVDATGLFIYFTIAGLILGL
jgi:Mg/Co/Ni transporter MgtE